jgi:hypothetical protein
MAGNKANQDRIDWVGFRIDFPPQPVTLLFTEIRLSGIPSTNQLVDKFGQSTLRNWADKVKDEADLKAKMARDEQDTTQTPVLPNRDQWGGWKDGPKLEATGRFRTQKLDGRWWIVTPSGTLFLSLGLNNIIAEESTLTEAREQMFQWLPDEKDPLARFYGKAGMILAGHVGEGSRTIDFGGLNSFRLYGEAWRENFYKNVERRIPSWGFNTLANWTDDALVQRRKIPYVATTAVWGPSRTLFGAPDPFNPVFEETLRSDIARVQPWAKNDPWCMGIFVDNEINWGSGDAGPGRIFYFRAALSTSSDNFAKQELRKHFEAKYGQIERLNQAWNTNFGSWNQLLQQPLTLTNEQLADPKIYGDGLEFSQMVYRQYFRVVKRVVNEMLPGTMLLGPRFHAWTPDAALIAAEYCDIVSFNSYSPEPRPGWLPKGFDAPVLFGEFGFRGRDSGFFNRVGTDAMTQRERGQKFANFSRVALADPRVVGLHWFRYRDQSVLGRPMDGENANFGFVQITDIPYRDMVTAARNLHRDIYQWRMRQSLIIR